MHAYNNLALTDDERLEAMVPPQALADAYVNRDIFGVQDFKVFDWARREKVNLLIKGPTQAAKTLALRAYGAYKREPVALVDVGAAMDPSLTLNTYYPDSTGKMIPRYGLLTLALKEGNSICVLDECNMAHAKVMSAYHSLGDGRRQINIVETGETVKAGPNVLIAATMNPDYIGTTPIGQAFSARFTHIPWDYDEAVERKLLAPSVRQFAARLRESEHIYTPVSTHLLMRLQDTVQQMGFDFAMSVFEASFQGDDEAEGLKHANSAGLGDRIRRELMGGN